jgi:hypothetical protein
MKRSRGRWQLESQLSKNTCKVESAFAVTANFSVIEFSARVL